MPKATRRLLVALIVMRIAGARQPAVARTSDQAPSDHVRTSNGTIATLIQQATERSLKFRELVHTINASDGIVYIEEGTCGNGMRSCFVNVTRAGANRILWVLLDARGVDCDLMGLIGHELQHTVEVLGHPQVTGFAAMYNFYAWAADSGHSFPFETDEAKRVGEAVRTEVRQKNRCTKVH
jgi:hypothetical protein